MNYLALDPSMSCTGWAFVTDYPSIALLGAGTIEPDGEGWFRCSNLMREIIALPEECGVAADRIIVETPFRTARKIPRQFQQRRSDLTLPNYGGAVGAACIAADMLTELDEYLPLHLGVDEWARAMPSTANDEYKLRRVALASETFKVPAEKFGAKTNAGNVADAALIGWFTITSGLKFSRREVVA